MSKELTLHLKILMVHVDEFFTSSPSFVDVSLFSVTMLAQDLKQSKVSVSEQNSLTLLGLYNFICYAAQTLTRDNGK